MAKVLNENSGEFTYYLPGEPKSYITHRDRTSREWTPNKAAYQIARVTLEGQHDDKPVFRGPIDMKITFYFKFPCHTLKRERVGPFHETSPSLLYLYRFIEEVARGILFERFNYVINLTLFKIYDEIPRTEIVIKERKR